MRNVPQELQEVIGDVVLAGSRDLSRGEYGMGLADEFSLGEVCE